MKEQAYRRDVRDGRGGSWEARSGFRLQAADRRSLCGAARARRISKREETQAQRARRQTLDIASILGISATESAGPIPDSVAVDSRTASPRDTPMPTRQAYAAPGSRQRVVEPAMVVAVPNSQIRSGPPAGHSGARTASRSTTCRQACCLLYKVDQNDETNRPDSRTKQLER